MNNIKLYFLKKTGSKLYPVKRHSPRIISRIIVRETRQMLSATKILSASTAEKSEVEQGRFLKRQ